MDTEYELLSTTDLISRLKQESLDLSNETYRLRFAIRIAIERLEEPRPERFSRMEIAIALRKALAP